jgi:hypothetical protein
MEFLDYQHNSRENKKIPIVAQQLTLLKKAEISGYNIGLKTEQS